jgi:hypothetical protein
MGTRDPLVLHHFFPERIHEGHHSQQQGKRQWRHTVLEEKQIYLETQVAEEDFPGSPTRQNQRLS